MGLMECVPGHSRLVTTPHPVSCEGQTNIVSALIPGETLGEFLRREVPDWTNDAWEVHVNGVMVPYEFLERVKPKDMTLIEVRGLAKKQALYIVAFIALSYFTMGIGSAAGAGLLGGAGIAGVVGGVSGALLAGAVFVAGSILINKVLGPKPPENGGQRDRDSVFSIGSGRNQARPNQPLTLVFGTVKFAPDVVSMPSWWYQNNDQYMGMVLTPGIGVASFEPLTNGDALLSSFQGVQVWQNGFSGMPDQVIPISTNVDTIAGGELNKNRTWVQRTTSTNTVRIEVNIEYSIGDANSKGKPITNTEIVDVEWRPVGGTGFTSLGTRSFRGSDPLVQRRETMTFVVPEGQYDVRVRIRGVAVDGGGSNGVARFQFGSMASVQVDNADYAGIPRIGIQIKATGQLNGAPDEIRGVMHTEAIPVWNGTAWVNQESSNPGAQILKYARGYFDQNGKRIAGIGLPDDMIDIPALQAFMLHCAANDYQYNYRVADVRNHEEMVNSLAMAAFGQVSWASGKMSVVWAASDQPLSGVVNMATIKQGEFQVDYTLANAADGIEYSYYDADDWTVKTLRVPAPGITTMLNPATVTGEGVTNEAQAAELARWHLAQSLYQYKDISYATDIEHLSYRRMSLLSISHDLTQWGFSGRLRGVSIVGGVVSLALDEPVRAPASGSAYIGLRIPGERTYRVFQVQSFTGETQALTLVQPWPSDAAVPGNNSANPAWDTIWCYDFKPTPGYRVRVVSIEPESDLKGARVAVVPEGPEFWNYVKTGEYIPPPNQSALQTRPVLSQLQIGERQVVQGDTIFTELTATFEVDGPVGDVVIQMSDADGLLSEVARTATRFASWRIPAAGTYTITARGFAPDGSAGNAISVIYTTIGADSPPVLVDLFDVVEQSGGVRLYTWGWLSTTTQSADFAGVEIRYGAGNILNPAWSSLSPVGNADGYHTAPFEAVIPESGQWTFVARSRNTSGTLSTGSKVVTKTLGANLGQQIGGIGSDIEAITQEQAAQQAEIDFAVEQAALAQAKSAEALALQGTAWNATTAWTTGTVVYRNGRMYRALQNSTNVPPPNPAFWQDIGTVTEAQGQTSQAVSQLRTDVDAQGVEFASAITQVRNGSAVDNLFPNAEFKDVASGKPRNLQVLLASNRTVTNQFMASGATDAGVPVGKDAYIVQFTSTVANSPQIIGMPGTYESWIAVEPSTEYIFSYYASGAEEYRARVTMTNNTGVNQGDTDGSPVTSGGGNALSLYGRPFVRFTTSATTRWVRPQFYSIHRAVGNSFSRFVAPQMERTIPGQTLPSPYNGGSAGISQVTFALQAGQDAQITLTTNVNGNISGITSKNDGQKSEFNVLASVFRVLTGGAATGMEWQANYIRIYGAGYQLVMGTGFGSSSNLVQWFGLNIGAANCTTANCVEAKTIAGQTIIRGSNGAGRMEFTNTAMVVYDANNVMRFRSGLF